MKTGKWVAEKSQVSMTGHAEMRIQQYNHPAENPNRRVVLWTSVTTKFKLQLSEQ